MWLAKVYLAMFAMAGPMFSMTVDACTIGIANGLVTMDGRPLAWKVRDTGNVRQQLVYTSASPYSYIGVRSEGGQCTTGLNTAGLSIGDSLVGTSAKSPTQLYLLTNYNRVEQIRNFYQGQEDAGELAEASCFPHLDAAGNASMFEVGSTSMSFYEYNTLDPDRTAQDLYGFVVRANEFHARSDGTDNTGIGGRYEAGTYNISGLVGLNMLSVRTIFQGNEGPNSGYEYARYAHRDLSDISRDSTGDVMVFHGVLPGEDPALTTMWLIIGQSSYGIAVPAWARVSDIPHCLGSGDMYTLVRSLYNKGNEATVQACTYPVESHHFDEIIGELLPHWRVHGIPSIADMTRIENRIANDAYSLLECLDVRQNNNRAPSVVLTDVSRGRTANFTADTNDPDGNVVSIAWNFGDQHISSESSAWHTYAAAGTYLVSCTATDDDGVSITDWKYCVIEEFSGDFEPDGDVDAADLRVLASYWLDSNCPGTSTCGGTNMTNDETVNFKDMGTFCQNWNPKPEVFVNPTPPVEIAVSSSADDAEQLNSASPRYPAGHMYLDSSDLELIDNNGYHGPDQTVGVRFNNVNIDQGSQVDYAYIQFTVSADEPDLNPCELTIRAQSDDNALPFTTDAFNITDRQVTSASVIWQPGAWTTGGVSGPDQQTPNVAPLIQEVVNRSGWSNGNSIVFIISGSGRRTAASWNGSAGGTARLVMNSVVVEQPSVANLEAGNITETSALLNGKVLHTGIENPMVSIFWGTSDGGVESDNWEHREDIGFKDAETFYVNVTGLSADVTYYFRCYAENSAGGSWASSTASFVAKKPAYKVNSASDDAEELNSNGEMYLTSSDLELINDDDFRSDGQAGSGDQTVGLRFNDIDIEPSTSIGSAYIQFTVKETGSDSCSLTIRGEATDDAAAFTMTDYNISSRTQTSASATWDPPAWNTVGQAEGAQRSPDISEIIAEIVNGDGWLNGNSLIIIITGSGLRNAKSYDGDTSAAPSLHIELE